MLIGETLKDMRDFSILLSIFIFIMSLIGMELFAFKVAFKDGDKIWGNY